MNDIALKRHGIVYTNFGLCLTRPLFHSYTGFIPSPPKCFGNENLKYCLLGRRVSQKSAFCSVKTLNASDEDGAKLKQ